MAGKPLTMNDAEEFAMLISRSIPRPPSAADVAKQLVVTHDAPARTVIPGSIGMTSKQLREYSILRGAMALARQSQGRVNFGSTFGEQQREHLDRQTNRAPDSLEMECSRAVAQALGRELMPGRLLVPVDVLCRDMTVAGVSGSDYLVGTSSPSFIAALRAASVTQRLGAQIVGPLKDNATLPRIASGAATYWLSDENTAITEGQPVIGELAMTPRNVAALFDLSHQLTKQIAPAGEQMLIADLGKAIGAAVDAAALAGSGSAGQPTGILNTSGLGGFTGASLDLAALTNAQTDICTGNAVVNENSLGYVTTPAVAALLKARQRFTGASLALWEGNVHRGVVEGSQAFSTTAMPTATAIYGDWSSLLIAEWGVLEIMVDPYSHFSTGVNSLRAMWSCDIAVQHPASFSIASSIS